MHTQEEIHKKGKAGNRTEMTKKNTGGVITVIKKGILPEIAGADRGRTAGIGGTTGTEAGTDMTALLDEKGRTETTGTVLRKCD